MNDTSDFDPVFYRIEKHNVVAVRHRTKILSQFTSLLTDLWILGEQMKEVEELTNKAIGNYRIVLRNVATNISKVGLRPR